MVKRWLNIIFILICYTMMTHSFVSAESSEWKSPSYNFGNIKRILLLEPKFIYTIKEKVEYGGKTAESKE